MRNFDNRAYKIQCNHNFYTQTYFYLRQTRLGLRQSIHTFWLFLQNHLAEISDKSCLKQDLVFDGVVIFIHYKMINLDSITNKNKKHNEKWPFTPDHPYRIPIIVGSGSEKQTHELIK